MASWKQYQTRGTGHLRFHYVCLACRKSFKLKPRAYLEPLGAKCPDCGRQLLNMGPDFKPPRRDNKSQWRKVKMLAACGLTFYSFGHSSCKPPKTLADAKRFAQVRRHNANAELAPQTILRQNKQIRRFKKQRKSIVN